MLGFWTGVVGGVFGLATFVLLIFKQHHIWRFLYRLWGPLNDLDSKSEKLYLVTRIAGFLSFVLAVGFLIATIVLVF